MADTNELKPCPCGKTPDRLGISDGGQGGKYHFVAGDCCSEWMIEFRANYKPIESDECMATAVAAWNASPRALVAIREATPPADAALADDDTEALAACLEDDAAVLRDHEEGWEEIARNMCDAAAALRARAVPEVQVTTTVDAIDAGDHEFIDALAERVGPLRGQVDHLRFVQRDGGVIVLWDGQNLSAVAMTVRDDFNRTKCLTVNMLAASKAATGGAK